MVKELIRSHWLHVSGPPCISILLSDYVLTLLENRPFLYSKFDIFYRDLPLSMRSPSTTVLFQDTSSQNAERCSECRNIWDLSPGWKGKISAVRGVSCFSKIPFA
eukprot:sb/3477909/